MSPRRDREASTKAPGLCVAFTSLAQKENCGFLSKSKGCCKRVPEEQQCHSFGVTHDDVTGLSCRLLIKSRFIYPVRPAAHNTFILRGVEGTLAVCPEPPARDKNNGGQRNGKGGKKGALRKYRGEERESKVPGLPLTGVAHLATSYIRFN